MSLSPGRITSCLLTLCESFQDQQVDLTQDSFQLTASTLRLEMCEILHVEQSLFSLVWLALSNISPTSFQARWIPVTHLPGVTPPGWGAWCCTQTPCFFWENLCDWDYPPICGLLAQGCESLLYYASAPLKHLVVPSFYLYYEKKSFLLVFKLLRDRFFLCE